MSDVFLTAEPEIHIAMYSSVYTKEQITVLEFMQKP